MKRNLLTMLFAGIFCAGCTNSTTEGIPAVENFQVERYAGKWYEIARMPNWFEKGMSNITAVYTVNSDGTLKVVNSGIKNGKSRSITGKAWFASRRDIGDLLVRFPYSFASPYRIIWLDNDYKMAVVTGSSYASLWILARKPAISSDELNKLLQWISALGYETGNLIFTVQQWQTKPANI